MKSWPPFDLRVQTPDLVLRLPNDEELDRLARRAVGRILTPETAAFLGTWATLPSPTFERDVAASHWRARAEWTPAEWRLQLVVFPDGRSEPIGSVGVWATDFAVCRQVTTGSWLLDSARGRGWGRQIRMGVLHLAFDHLGAHIARSEASTDNAPSLSVSRSIGYRDDGTDRAAFAGRVVDLRRVRLDASEWWCPEGHSVTGLDQCRDMFDD